LPKINLFVDEFIVNMMWKIDLLHW